MLGELSSFWILVYAYVSIQKTDNNALTQRGNVLGKAIIITQRRRWAMGHEATRVTSTSQAFESILLPSKEKLQIQDGTMVHKRNSVRELQRELASRRLGEVTDLVVLVKELDVVLLV